MIDYSIDEIWAVNTTLVPNGGIGINWSGPIGFGQFVLYWGEDNKLHADTEHLASNNNKIFLKKMLNLLADEIVIDG